MEQQLEPRADPPTPAPQHYDLPLCRPLPPPLAPSPANLGELLSGDLLYDSLWVPAAPPASACVHRLRG
jgi:hypothetical protein